MRKTVQTGSIAASIMIIETPALVDAKGSLQDGPVALTITDEQGGKGGEPREISNRPPSDVRGTFCVRRYGECRILRVGWLNLLKTLNRDLDRIRLDWPTLAPVAHAMFCLQYPKDCEGLATSFGGNKLKLTAQRWQDLVSVNADVNRRIAPQPNALRSAEEQWEISPRSGDCNDYAVTKRHDLLARGWPSGVLLLAEVVTPSGEHHLVLVVRTKDGDFVLDNLSANVRPWAQIAYRLSRVQSPLNPRFWLTPRSTGV
jgi:predicted transglutaminase-like cysteine proteinase